MENILNGKALESFKEWYNKTYDNYHFKDSMLWIEIPENIQHALIIEWLDSVGIFINIKSYKFIYDWSYEIKQVAKRTIVMEDDLQATIKSRQEATEKAIEKAVEIYNSKN